MEPETPPVDEPSPEEAHGPAPEDEGEVPEPEGPQPLDEDELLAGAAAEPAEPSSAPAEVPKRPDRRRLLAVVAAAVLLLLLLSGVLFLLRARRDVSALQGELRALREEVRRSQVQQERGAVLRVRAELQALRQTIRPDLATEIDKADALLGGIDDRLRASP
ncbi:MAG: hypothetical protein HZB55_04005 [Deltaproteobacteria bacterium]|nr:hypothetical protein [Deltaproteobacteria bacterium]